MARARSARREARTDGCACRRIRCHRSVPASQLLTDGAQVGAWASTLWFAVVLTLPTSLLSGVFFTLLGDRLRQRIRGEARAAGWLALANTAGGMVGPLVAAFVLLPVVGTERAFFALAAAYVVTGGLALAGVGGVRWCLAVADFAATTLVAAIALIGFPFGLMDRIYVPRIARPYTADGSVIVATARNIERSSSWSRNGSSSRFTTGW